MIEVEKINSFAIHFLKENCYIILHCFSIVYLQSFKL